MGRVRVKLDFTFEWPGAGAPRELMIASNADLFIAAGLREAGVLAGVQLLPGATWEVKALSEKKPPKKKPAPSFDELLSRSSIGQAMKELREDPEAHLAQLEKEFPSAPRRKR